MSDFIQVEDLDDSVFGKSADDKLTILKALLGNLPRYELGGEIADYENQSGSNELVWTGGTVADPSCIWIVYPDDSYTKIKSIEQGDAEFCPAVLSCVADDVNRGAGSPDCYLVPEMDGPTWRVVSVEWGTESDADIDFSTDTGTDLASLVVALNASDNLPEGWSWDIITSQLALCVPHGTVMGKVVLEGGEESDFTDGPDVEGSAASTLSENIIVQQVVSGGGTSITSAHDTQAEIEAQFATNNAVTVRWVDEDGNQRVSYKDPVNGWYHPFSNDLVPAVALDTFTETGSGATDNTSDLIAAGVPSYATHVSFKVGVFFNFAVVTLANTGYAEFFLDNSNAKKGTRVAQTAADSEPDIFPEFFYHDVPVSHIADLAAYPIRTVFNDGGSATNSVDFIISIEGYSVK